MQCKLCQLEYGVVNEQDLCGGCAHDMAEAERILRSSKASFNARPIDADSDLADSQDQLADPVLVCSNPDLPREVHAYESISKAAA